MYKRRKNIHFKCIYEYYTRRKTKRSHFRRMISIDLGMTIDFSDNKLFRFPRVQLCSDDCGYHTKVADTFGRDIRLG